MNEFSYDVFLSHNAKDKPRVRRLAERLQQAGLRVWFDEWSVRSGDIITLKVDEGLIRQMDETSGGQTIRWMNVTRYLKKRKDKKSRQILFAGEKLDMEAMWKVRDQFFPPKVQARKE